jgi:hypothetical protein
MQKEDGWLGSFLPALVQPRPAYPNRPAASPPTRSSPGSAAMEYESFFKRYPDGLHHEGRSGVFADFERCCSRIPCAFDHRLSAEVTAWHSNDCLGNSEHPALIEGIVSVSRAFDTGGGMRNISGNNHIRLRFEAERRLHRATGPVDVSQDVILHQAVSFRS